MPSFGLDHIKAALGRLGDPQDAIASAIHITGTNGKGSTAAFIRAIAEAAGRRVHVFTSPHLIRVNERIRLAGRLVGDETLADALSRVAAAGPDLTYFEALTAAAYLLFAETPADLSVIEVGAGGTGDATNVMRNPAACVVTPVSRDHEAMFGVSGLAAIARVKAGIFRPGVPAVIAAQDPIVRGVLMEEARKGGARTSVAGRDWMSGWDDNAFVFNGARLAVRSPWLALAGRVQAQNAGAACAALEAVSPGWLDAETASTGLRAAVWPARLQKLGPGPLTKDSGAGIWVDAAHNPAGAAMLADAILGAKEAGGGHVAVVAAMQAAKDARGIVSELARAADVLVACPLPSSGGQEGGPGAAPEELSLLAREFGLPAEIRPDEISAVRRAQALGAQLIYVCGSLYLCGAVLRANDETVK